MGLSILQKHFTFWTSIIITSAVFSLVHVGQLFTEDHAVLQLFSRFIHGIFYSLVFRTGGLWLSTGVHWFWNVGVFALGFFPSHENTAFLTWVSKIDEQVLTPYLVPYFLFVTILWCGSSSLKVTET
jgi:membrane protease YdiL (CAAX protease family)